MPPERYDAVVIGSGFGGSVVACRMAQAGAWCSCSSAAGRGRPASSRARRASRAARCGRRAAGATASTSTATSRASTRSPPAGSAAARSSTPTSCCARTPTTFAADGLPLAPAELDRHYDAVQRCSAPSATRGRTARPKTRALLDAARIAGLSAERPPLAVAFGERPGQPFDDGTANLHGAPRETCRLCGECDVGCQYGAKHTLDFTYLTAAVDARGARPHLLRGGRARPRRRRLARALPPAPGRARGHPEHLLDPVAQPDREVRADRVVLAAGTFGSTGLLLRNRAALPGLSPRLGRGFSGNGDLLFFLLGADRYLDPATGPVITASVRVPDAESPSGRGFLLQDAGAPAFSEWLWQGLEAPGDLGARCAGARRPRRSGPRARRPRWRRCWAWAATCPAGAWSCAATAWC